MHSKTKYLWRVLLKLICVIIIGTFVANPSLVWAAAYVNIQGGFFSYDSVDLRIDGLYPLTVNRHYQTAGTVRSRQCNYVSSRVGGGPNTPSCELQDDFIEPRHLKAGPFGVGTHMGIYSLKAQRQANPNQITLSMPTGEKTVFKFSSANLYINSSRGDSLQGKVTTTADSVVFIYEDGTKLVFIASNNYGISSITDRFDKAIVMTYMGGKLTRVTDPFGRYIAFTYDLIYPDQVAKAERFDNLNQSYGHVKYEYTNGDLTTFTNMIDGQSIPTSDGSYRIANGKTIYTYDDTHYMREIKNPRGVVALKNYYENTNSYGKVYRQVKPGTDAISTTDDIMTSYTYNYNVTDVKDTNGVATSYLYDFEKLYLLQKTHQADDSTTTYEYDTTSRLMKSQKNPISQETKYTYTFNETYDNLQTVTSSDGAVTTYDFSAPYGQIKLYTDANQNTTSFTYDTQTALLKEMNTSLPQNDYFDSYNDYGQLSAYRDGKGRMTYYFYDNAYKDMTSIQDESGIVINNAH
uniref:hypothetical protein n=1 Tax=Candidatus Cyanaurora vandensis TaxID=2714958 RepID=UPI00257F05F2